MLCDKRISLKLKERVNHLVVTPTLLYDAECWPTKKLHLQGMKVADIRMIRWICLDKISNEVIKGKLEVVFI